MNDAPQQKWLMTAATGVGLAVLPHFVGDPDPRLKRYDVTPAPPSRDVWLLVHRDLRHAPFVRAVMEFLTDCIKPK